MCNNEQLNNKRQKQNFCAGGETENITKPKNI